MPKVAIVVAWQHCAGGARITPPGRLAMTFESILLRRGADRAGEPVETPACLADLNLDQVIEALAAGREQALAHRRSGSRADRGLQPLSDLRCRVSACSLCPCACLAALLTGAGFPLARE
jgi:hypothetical protein